MSEDKKKGFSRRDIIKSLATIPVLGLYGYSLLKKLSFDKKKGDDLLQELGLDTQGKHESVKPSGDQIRIGMIGLGDRGTYLARALGFPHLQWVKDNTTDGKYNTSIRNYFNHYDLNVQITGICDVFDVRAEKGLQIAKNKFTRDGVSVSIPEAKRYSH